MEWLYRCVLANDLLAAATREPANQSTWTLSQPLR